jgi:hypothetical protein
VLEPPPRPPTSTDSLVGGAVEIRGVIKIKNKIITIIAMQAILIKNNQQ